MSDVWWDQTRSQFVSGKGNVLTGTGSSSKGLVGLVDLPGLAKVEGNHQAGMPDSIRITNTSGSPLQFWTGGGGTVPANASVDVSLPHAAPTALVQLLLPAVQVVATLTVGAISTQTGANFMAQALMETL